MNPLVSVIMTTYNRAIILPRAVNSVLRQNYDNIELIIVNDKSDDNTIDVIKELQKQDKRIFLVDREISSAEEQLRTGNAIDPVNDGLRIAKGKYIAHLDDDDVFWQDKFRISVRALEENVHIGLIYGNWLSIEWIDGKEDICVFCRREFSYERLIEKGNYFGNLETIYRKAVYDDVGEWSFDLSGGRNKRMGRVGADYNYWMRVGKKYEIMHIPFVVGVGIAREHPDYMNPDRDFWNIKEWSCYDDTTGTRYDGGFKFE